MVYCEFKRLKIKVLKFRTVIFIRKYFTNKLFFKITVSPSVSVITGEKNVLVNIQAPWGYQLMTTVKFPTEAPPENNSIIKRCS